MNTIHLVETISWVLLWSKEIWGALEIQSTVKKIKISSKELQKVVLMSPNANIRKDMLEKICLKKAGVPYFSLAINQTLPRTGSIVNIS